MLNRVPSITERSLRGLHPKSIDDPVEVRNLLVRAAASRTPLYRGLNDDIDLETAFIDSVAGGSLVLETVNFDERANQSQIFLRFDDEDRPYFFATRRVGFADPKRLVVEVPRSVFYRERRDRLRRSPNPAEGDPRRVEIAVSGRGLCEGRIQDLSASGMGLLVPATPSLDSNVRLTVRYLDGRNPGIQADFEIRSTSDVAQPQGWKRIGLVRADAVARDLVDVESWDAFEPPGMVLPELAPPLQPERVPDEPKVMRLELEGAEGTQEHLTYLVDRWGDPSGATAVLITNGWGQAKEVFLPLARTLVSTFRAHGLPIEVIRFDGIRKRGESYVDPQCRVPGRETQNFVFSQGVRDIQALASHLRESTTHGASRIILISFSASAIEARKAVAIDGGRRIDGWISVVGAPDLQSMARSISGGVDYVGGHEFGLSFGVQELLGVRVDVDQMAADAARNGMSFLEDSRRDLSKIRVPISWFHGRYDAWVDLFRVRDILSMGETGARRLVVLPIGHQIKTSRQADLTFRLIAREVARIASGRDLEPVSPPTRVVRHLKLAEGRRRPDPGTDLQSFWRDYLVGRDRSLGIELLTAGSAYQAMMSRQIEALQIRAGDRIVDLGSGTGGLPVTLARDPAAPHDLEVIALDYVREGLDRTRKRLDAISGRRGLEYIPIEANLDLLDELQRVPMADCSADRVIASLLISYLERPELLLAEIFRILRPDGRLVLSTLCRDADISRLYVESLAELQSGDAIGELPELRGADLGTAARNFLNDAARILELEDTGAFRFMDPDELSELVADAGFDQIRVDRTLGNPAQAVVLSARRPLLRSPREVRPSSKRGDSSKRAPMLKFFDPQPIGYATCRQTSGISIESTGITLPGTYSGLRSATPS